MRHRKLRLALVIFLAALSAAGSADAYTRRVYDTSLGTAWSQLEPGNPAYPVEYSPYIFGRREGQPPRGPNPVPGHAFGSVDVDAVYDEIPFLHQFYLDKFGRNGPNGQGGLGNSTDPVSGPNNVPLDEYRILVNENYRNAFWTTPRISIGAGYFSLDVLAHEATHALFFYENNSSSNWGQDGALEESFGDFFGAAYEYYRTGSTDWLQGSRNLADPPSGRYDGRPYPARFLSPNYYSSGDDHGGVHINSTVLSKAAFLATEGGSFNGFEVSGIGIEKMEQIWYRALTEYFYGGVAFNGAYPLIIQAANDLYSPEDVWEVTKALRAVEINVPFNFNGDFAADLDVDGADFLAWQRGLGSLYSAGMLDRWKANFGTSSISSVSIPEPTALMLVVQLVLIFGGRCHLSRLRKKSSPTFTS